MEATTIGRDMEEYKEGLASLQTTKKALLTLRCQYWSSTRGGYFHIPSSKMACTNYNRYTADSDPLPKICLSLANLDTKHFSVDIPCLLFLLRQLWYVLLSTTATGHHIFSASRGGLHGFDQEDSTLLQQYDGLSARQEQVVPWEMHAQYSCLVIQWAATGKKFTRMHVALLLKGKHWLYA